MEQALSKNTRVAAIISLPLPLLLHVQRGCPLVLTLLHAATTDSCGSMTTPSSMPRSTCAPASSSSSGSNTSLYSWMDEKVFGTVRRVSYTPLPSSALLQRAK
eukprot:GHRQ01040105.1.p1 GENE.GHRQ01040105.1~~GHRQ01040105.1.p1  ORF type:complete len:103 (-),score=0.60 GHRQ01040105.1:251-559(-)